MILTKSNRRNGMAARKDGLKSMWCGRCDRDVVGDYGKCGACGYSRKKEKKKIPRLEKLEELL